MRKLWTVAAILLVVLLATMATAALSLNRIIAANRDRIIGEAQAALGRRVAIGAIHIGFWGGIAVALDDVRVGDDPRFASADFVRVTTVSAHAQLWPLLHQRFEVGRV